ncbi:MAG: glycosyltransferase [Candidatus Asgardarchaeia archaeon]
MKRPKVSIIMTVYNCEEFIEEALDSIFSQTFKDFELIVYDDASTDNTFEILKAYSKGGILNRFIAIKELGEKKNIGCGAGRNEAIRYAQGKYLAIHDADDISFPERLEKEVAFLEDHQDVFCVSSWAIKIDENGEELEIMDYPPPTHKEIRAEFLKVKNPIIDPASMFRRRAFEKIGGYSAEWRLVPDFYLWGKAISYGYKFDNILQPLVYYRKHDNSVTTIHQDKTVGEHFTMCRKYWPQFFGIEVRQKSWVKSDC